MKRKHRGWKIALCVVLALVVCIAGTQTAIYFHRSEPASVKPYIGSFRYITTDGKAMVSAHRRGRFESGRVYGRFQKLCGEQGFSDGYF